jgi:hypothetical protein
LVAIAADLLMEGNPHKPYLHHHAHTPQSFEAYLLDGTLIGQTKDKYPFPIAIVSRRLANAQRGLETFSLLLDFFEVVIRFIVLVQIADYMSSQQKAPLDVRSGLSELSKPSLGTWVNLFRFLRQRQTENAFLKEIKAQKIREKTLDDFVKLRNDFRGHGATQTTADYRLMFRDHIGRMSDLYHAVSFLKGYWLVYPSLMWKDGAEFQISVRSLMGDNPNFEAHDIPSPRAFETNKVTYLDRNLVPLVLHPYVILEICPRCKREELLLFDSIKEKEIRTYLINPLPHACSVSGHNFWVAHHAEWRDL